MYNHNKYNHCIIIITSTTIAQCIYLRLWTQVAANELRRCYLRCFASSNCRWCESMSHIIPSLQMMWKHVSYHSIPSLQVMWEHISYHSIQSCLVFNSRYKQMCIHCEWTWYTHTYIVLFSPHTYIVFFSCILFKYATLKVWVCL